MADLLQAIKQAATEAVAAGEPADVEYGTVVSASPISIRLDSKEVLTKEFLVLTRSVTGHTVSMTVDGTTKQYTVNSGLRAGEKVILLKMQGGQTYVVLDRIGG